MKKKCYDCLLWPVAGTVNDSTFYLAYLISEFSKSFLFCFLRLSTRVTLSNRTVSTLSAYDYKEMFIQNKPKQRKCFVISNGTVRLGGNWECFSKTGKVRCFTTVPMETGASTVCTSCSSFLMPDVQQWLITALLWITSGCQRNWKAHYLLSSSFLNCDADMLRPLLFVWNGTQALWLHTAISKRCQWAEVTFAALVLKIPTVIIVNYIFTVYSDRGLVLQRQHGYCRITQSCENWVNRPDKQSFPAKPGTDGRTQCYENTLWCSFGKRRAQNVALLVLL